MLHISGLREDDSGIYTCKAVNRVGEAVSTCNLKVHGNYRFLLFIASIKNNLYSDRPDIRNNEWYLTTFDCFFTDRDWLIGDSMRPEALPRLAKFDEPRDSGRGEEQEPIYDLPVFISHLNDVENREGDAAHFECKVEPSKDPTMKIGEILNIN